MFRVSFLLTRLPFFHRLNGGDNKTSAGAFIRGNLGSGGQKRIAPNHRPVANDDAGQNQFHFSLLVPVQDVRIQPHRRAENDVVPDPQKRAIQNSQPGTPVSQPADPRSPKPQPEAVKTRNQTNQFFEDGQAAEDHLEIGQCPPSKKRTSSEPKCALREWGREFSRRGLPKAAPNIKRPRRRLIRHPNGDQAIPTTAVIANPVQQRQTIEARASKAVEPDGTDCHQLSFFHFPRFP